MLTLLLNNACGQDGAPLHYARNVRNTLNQMFSNRWIRKSGSTSWSPRSSDLIWHNWIFSLDYLKSIVYQEQPTTLDENADKDGLCKYFSHLCKRKEPSQNGLDYICTCGVSLNIIDKPKIMSLYDLV